jgi:hypothetical protein
MHLEVNIFFPIVVIQKLDMIIVLLLKGRVIGNYWQAFNNDLNISISIRADHTWVIPLA